MFESITPELEARAAESIVETAPAEIPEIDGHWDKIGQQLSNAPAKVAHVESELADAAETPVEDQAEAIDQMNVELDDIQVEWSQPAVVDESVMITSWPAEIDVVRAQMAGGNDRSEETLAEKNWPEKNDDQDEDMAMACESDSDQKAGGWRRFFGKH